MDEHWDLTAAEKDFQRAPAIDPNSSDAHNGRAWALFVTGRIDDALREMAYARNIDPESPLVETNSCFLLRVIGQLNEALPHCNAALDLDPSYNWALANTAVVYGDLKAFDKAHEILNRSPWCSTQLEGLHRIE